MQHMQFNEYQEKALSTAHTDPAYVDTLMDKTIWVMGVAGEAGEVVEKWKKMVAYNKGEITQEFVDDVVHRCPRT
jgi:hypothetical protein